ncbi:MAG TPA: radical SAM protein [bacterium]|nr:radical SAM protein [bacterium]HPJ72619.1 radical SAM protein [bacterium]HPQ66550.1 radical SAM protein [bacterium]
MSLPAKIGLGLRFPETLGERFRARRAPRRLPRDPDGSLRLEAPLPVTLSLNVIHACNLRCRMCGQWRREDGSRPERLEPEALRPVIDAVAPAKPKIYIWGGEPLIHPRIDEIVGYVKSRSLYTVVNTNGVLLERHADRLVELGVDGLDISIDGPREIHDRVRGVPGTYDRVMKGVEAVVRRRRRKPMIKAVSVITADSLPSLDQTLKEIARSGFDAAIFNLGWFATEEVGRATERYFSRHLGCEARSWKDFVGVLGTVDPAEVAKFMRRASRIGFPVFFIPAVRPEQVEEYYSRPASFLGRRTCYMPWLSPDIRPGGDVTFCPDFPDYTIGNINTDSFPLLWNGEKAIRFRRALRDHGLFPLCSRCCGLYAFGGGV